MMRVRGDSEDPWPGTIAYLTANPLERGDLVAFLGRNDTGIHSFCTACAGEKTKSEPFVAITIDWTRAQI